MQIKVGRSHLAIIDEADASLVSGQTWFAVKTGGHVYAVSAGGELMHRVILGAVTGQIVDHANGCGLDNRRSNLRFCTVRQNAANSKKKSHSTQPYKGVRKYHQRWRALLSIDGKRRLLGTFHTAEAAARVYDAAARLHFGEFARTNFT